MRSPDVVPHAPLAPCKEDGATPREPEALLRFHEVKARVGLSKTTIYRLIHSGHFPAPRAITERAVGWRQSAIDDWIRDRIKQSQGGGNAAT